MWRKLPDFWAEKKAQIPVTSVAVMVLDFSVPNLGAIWMVLFGVFHSPCKKDLLMSEGIKYPEKDHLDGCKMDSPNLHFLTPKPIAIGACYRTEKARAPQKCRGECRGTVPGKIGLLWGLRGAVPFLCFSKKRSLPALLPAGPPAVPFFQTLFPTLFPALLGDPEISQSCSRRPRLQPKDVPFPNCLGPLQRALEDSIQVKKDVAMSCHKTELGTKRAFLFTR